MGTSKTTEVMQAPEWHRERLHGIVKTARTVMLLSHRGDQRIIGRPVAVARVDDDTTLHLVTAANGHHVTELEREPRVAVLIQTPAGLAMLDGIARISRELGDDAPNVVIVIRPQVGTYWERGPGDGDTYVFPQPRARAKTVTRVSLRQRA